MRLNRRMATAQGGNTGRFGPWFGWLLTFLALVAVGALVLWWVMTVGLKPVEDPSASPSPSGSTGTSAVIGFAQVNGRWCDSDTRNDEATCVMIKLPMATFDDAEEPLVVYPGDNIAQADPSTFEYPSSPNFGECWRFVIDTATPESGSAFIYCPAQALSGEEWIDADDTTVDRIYITLEDGTPPWLREQS